MKEELLRGILIDVDNGNAEVKCIKDELVNFYEMLNCDTIDVANRKIGDRYYDIVCDDEGLLKDNPTPSAVNSKSEVQLVGNLFIIHGVPDEEGDFRSLTDEEVEEVEKHIFQAIYGDKVIPILTDVEY